MRVFQLDTGTPLKNIPFQLCQSRSVLFGTPMSVDLPLATTTRQKQNCRIIIARAEVASVPRLLATVVRPGPVVLQRLDIEPRDC